VKQEQMEEMPKGFSGWAREFVEANSAPDGSFDRGAMYAAVCAACPGEYRPDPVKLVNEAIWKQFLAAVKGVGYRLTNQALAASGTAIFSMADAGVLQMELPFDEVFQVWVSRARRSAAIDKALDADIDEYLTNHADVALSRKQVRAMIRKAMVA